MIRVNNLTKFYGNNPAVSNLSFSIDKGQIYGFLGPNGAGKSTTMNIMTGCLAATYGDVRIGGYDIYKDAKKAKSLIGFLPEVPPLYFDITPFEYLSFVAEAKNTPRSEIGAQIEDVLEKTGTSSVRNRLIKHLSKGYRQRVGLAQALVGNPEVIILDEPTAGLDPMQIIEIRDLIKELGENHTVILSSHILSEVQAVCSTVLIIDKGKLLACDTPENLEKHFSGKVTISIISETGADEAKSILSTVSGIEAVDVLSEEKKRSELKIACSSYDEDEMSRRIFYAFSSANRALLRLIPERITLESVFIELTRRAEDEAKGGPAAEPKVSESDRDDAENEAAG